jgi:putative restriction endonuclease
MISQRIFASRKDIYEAGLHNSYQRGIGRARDGTDNMSIVLSGGYVDDEDHGKIIIYTGEGGRDPNTGAQIADQEISGGNKNLVSSFELGKPVYVIRGSGHKSPFSPNAGYEYAGEYYITEHWIEKGRNGFNVIRFKLISEREPITFTDEKISETKRTEYTSTRIIRDTKLAKQVKEIYDYSCQVCGTRIKLPTGSLYAEGAHVRPLGTPHNGPDAIENLLSLCPNHHLMFDKYCYSINPVTLELEGLDGSLTVKDEHVLNREFLSYHYENYIAHH